MAAERSGLTLRVRDAVPVAGPAPGARGERRRSTRRPVVRARAPGRLLVVGVREASHDAAALRWAVGEARAGRDVVHVVHAYVPSTVATGKIPVDDPRLHAGRRIVAQAVEQAAHPGQRVEGSAVAGLPGDVLEEFSAFADLLVIGDDPDPAERTRKTGWHVADIASCPVVCVPTSGGPAPDRQPVSLVVGRHGLTAAANRFAFGWARAHHTGVQVCLGGAPDDGPPGSVTQAARHHEEIHRRLADLQAAHPDVPVVTRTEYAANWLLHAGATSSLLVVPAADLVATACAMSTSTARRCPLVIVPDPLSGPST